MLDYWKIFIESFSREVIVWLFAYSLASCSTISSDVAWGWQTAKRHEIQFVLVGVYIGPKPISTPRDIGVDDVPKDFDNSNETLKPMSWLVE